MASGVVRNDDESASLLDDDDDWSPVAAAAAYPLPPSPLNVKAAAMRSPGHAVMRLIRSPFAAAVSRMTTSTRTAAAVSASDGQPMRNGDKMTAVTERRREARRGRSLEQLLKIEAASPPSPTPSRPDRKSKPGTAAPTYKVVSTRTVKEKRAREPLPPSSKGHVTAVVGDDKRRHAAAVPVPAAVKSGSGAGAGGGRRTTNAKRLVVVLESLRTCSRDAAIDVVMPILPKRTNGKVAAAAGRAAPGKAELFYCRPIPMGRRCRVQHLEETPYK